MAFDIRHNAEIHCIPKTANGAACTLECANEHHLKILHFCPHRIDDHTNSHFVFKFPGNRPLGLKQLKRCIVLLTKNPENAVSLSPFCAHLAEGAKVSRGGCHLSRRIHPKFCPKRFRFARVISYDFVRLQHMPVAHND